MKVPYLNKKKANEFQIYLSELENHIAARITQSRSEQDAKDFFSKLYPLFVLLRGFANSEYLRDPTRDIILWELRAAGRKPDFLKILQNFERNRQYRAELTIGLQKQVFMGYFEELFSDGLLLLNSFYTCNYRGAFVAIRCMLEDLYRHLYYRDHQQEFWALCQSGVWDESSLGMTPQKFRSYLETTEYLSVFRELNTSFEKRPKKQDKEKQDKEMNLFGLNEHLYSQCSRFVHGSATADLSRFKSNADMVPNPDRAKEVVSIAGSFVNLSIAFLIAAHFDHFLAFGEYERSLVLDSFEQNSRAAFRRVLNL